MIIKERFYQKWYHIALTFPILGSVVASSIYSLIEKKSFIVVLSLVCNWVFKIFILILTYTIPVWVIIIAFLSLFLILLLASKLNAKEIVQPHLQYTQDIFKQWKWYWRYGLKNGEIIITDMRPECPECHVFMHYFIETHGNSASCPNCKTYFDNRNSENAADIQLLIIDKIEKKKYSRV